MFVYSGQWIHTILSYEDQVKKDIRRVQGLKGDCDPWVEDTFQDGVMHVTDNLTILPGVQSTKAK